MRTLRQLKELTSQQDVLYHGSNAKFDKFSLKNFGKTDDGWYGVGIYFHSDIDTAKVYGLNIYKVKLNYKKPLILPVDYAGRFLFKTLEKLGIDMPNDYLNYSPMKIIKNIGKQEFTDIIKKQYDAMVINYAQGTKQVVVFNPSIIEIISK